MTAKPARIGGALALLALGIGGAWLFRKPPETPRNPKSSPQRSLVLRESAGEKSGAAAAPAGQQRRFVWRPLASIAATPSPPSPLERENTPPPIPSSFRYNGPIRSAWDEPVPSGDETRVEREPPTPSPRWVMHKVVDGDTLPRLARQYLGDASLATHIYQDNRQELADPDVLPVGVHLRVNVALRKTKDKESPPAAEGWRGRSKTIE